MSELALGAVLWDMDGTLIDSEPLWLEAETRMLARFGISMTEETHRLMIGSGLRDAAQHFRGLGVRLSVDEIIDEWVDHVSAGLVRSGADWRPGARELLASLGDAGIPCALVTMSVRAFADRVIELLPPGAFAASIAGDEVRYEKPHPEPYLRGAAALGVRIERCLALEDSPTGLRSAAASGAVAVGVPNLVDLRGAPAHELLPGLDGVDAAQLSERFAALR